MTRKIVRAVNTEFCQSSFWIWNKNESIFWSFAAFTDWWQQITILRMVDSFISIFMSFHIIYCCSKPSFFFRDSGIGGGSGRGIPKPTYESKIKILIKAKLFKKRVTWPAHWPISDELWSLHNISGATYLMTSHVTSALWTLPPNYLVLST